MSESAHFLGLERMYAGAAANRALSPALKVAQDHARIECTLTPEVFHSGGATHGATLFKLLDDAAFFAAQSRWTDRLALTASFSIWFLRPAGAVPVVADGRVVHRARSFVLAEAELVDARGRALARGSGTFLPGGPPRWPGVGYVPSDG